MLDRVRKFFSNRSIGICESCKSKLTIFSKKYIRYNYQGMAVKVCLDCSTLYFSTFRSYWNYQISRNTGRREIESSYITEEKELEKEKKFDERYPPY